MKQRAEIAIVALVLLLFALAAPPAKAALDPPIVGQWRFDEPAGQTALDDGPFALHGQFGASAAVEGTDPVRVPGASGGAIHLDGNSYVSVGDGRRLDLPALAVEAVVRAPAGPGSYRYVVSHRSKGCMSGSYGLYTGVSGGIAFYIFDGERYYVSATASPADVWTGAWHVVTGTFDGSEVRVFVDGRAVGDALATPPGTAIEYESMPDSTYFGTYRGTCELPFVGDLDSVRISSGALPTPDAVAGAVGTTPGQPPLPAAAHSAVKPAPALASRSTCSVRLLSKSRIKARRRSFVTVRAMNGGKPLRDVRVSVTRAGKRKVLTAKRTNASGRAKLSLKGQQAGRLRIGIPSRPACVPAFVRVARAR
jgi:hypothetical protein